MEDILQVLQTSWPILLMVVIFYFLLWRPQKKQQKERANLLGSLKKGQKIVTIG
ncbi:Preprotein translocase, YajC subunit, partial [human gut metagenome]